MKSCPDCGSNLGSTATKCRCGWKAASFATVQEERRISCCYADCIEGAICRVWTKTGWANVCKTHYPTIATVVRKSSSSIVTQMREEMQARLDRKAVAQNLDTLSKHVVQAETPREPGEDDEYALLQEELGKRLAERANP